MKNRFTLIILFCAAMFLVNSASVAYAYVGPGPGLTVIGALWAVIAAVLLAILAIVRWPLRYLLRRIRGKGALKETQPEVVDGTKFEKKDLKNED
jgi:hypothetical protein